MRSKRILQLLPILLLLGLSIYLFIKYRIPPKIPFSNIELYTPEGVPVDFETLLGKPTIVNFWGTWCSTCLKEMPALNYAYKQLKSEGLQVIAISDENADKIAAYKNKKGFDFIYLLSAKPLKTYNIHAFPTTYILDKKGDVKMQRTGTIMPFEDERFIERIREEVL